MRWTRFDEDSCRAQGSATGPAPTPTAEPDPVDGRLVADARLGKVLCAILSNHVGERGDSESAVECLHRIIAERDAPVYFYIGIDPAVAGADVTVLMEWFEVPDQSDYIDELQQKIDELDVERSNMRIDLDELRAENQRLRDDRPVIRVESNSDHDKVTVAFRGFETAIQL